jgi:hypothetical protein
MASNDIPPAADPRSYVLDEIVLYGVQLNGVGSEASANIAIDHEPKTSEVLHLRLSVTRDHAPMPHTEFVIASVTAYAFEGHCYRLAKPKILLFRSDHPERPARGCGFEEITGPLSEDTYRMWRIRTKTPLVELGVSSSFADELILQATLPGARPPSTYSLDMELAHRSGRLSKS